MRNRRQKGKGWVVEEGHHASQRGFWLRAGAAGQVQDVRDLSLAIPWMMGDGMIGGGEGVQMGEQWRAFQLSEFDASDPHEV
jgi:hypothetical protein